MNFIILPNELIEHIFSYLSTRDIFSSIVYVCKRFNQIARYINKHIEFIPSHRRQSLSQPSSEYSSIHLKNFLQSLIKYRYSQDTKKIRVLCSLSISKIYSDLSFSSFFIFSHPVIHSFTSSNSSPLSSPSSPSLLVSPTPTLPPTPPTLSPAPSSSESISSISPPPTPISNNLFSDEFSSSLTPSQNDEEEMIPESLSVTKISPLIHSSFSGLNESVPHIFHLFQIVQNLTLRECTLTFTNEEISAAFNFFSKGQSHTSYEKTEFEEENNFQKPILKGFSMHYCLLKFPTFETQYMFWKLLFGLCRIQSFTIAHCQLTTDHSSTMLPLSFTSSFHQDTPQDPNTIFTRRSYSLKFSKKKTEHPNFHSINEETNFENINNNPSLEPQTHYFFSPKTKNNHLNFDSIFLYLSSPISIDKETFHSFLTELHVSGLSREYNGWLDLIIRCIRNSKLPYLQKITFSDFYPDHSLKHISLLSPPSPPSASSNPIIFEQVSSKTPISLSSDLSISSHPPSKHIFSHITHLILRNSLSSHLFQRHQSYPGTLNEHITQESLSTHSFQDHLDSFHLFCEEISDILKQVQVIDLSQNCLNDRHLNTLLKILFYDFLHPRNTFLSTTTTTTTTTTSFPYSLSFNYNHILRERSPSSLKELYLRDNQLTHISGFYLSDILSSSICSLKVLDLHSNLIGDSGLNEICLSLENNFSLFKVDFSQNKLTKKSLKNLFSILKNKTSTTTNSSFSPDALLQQSSNKQKSNSLTNNQTSLSRKRKVSSQHEEGENFNFEKGRQSIPQQIDNKSLQIEWLSLSDNQLSDSIFGLITILEDTKCSMKSLHLDRCSIPSESTLSFSISLFRNPSLTFLSLSESDLSREFQYSLTIALLLQQNSDLYQNQPVRLSEHIRDSHNMSPDLNQYLKNFLESQKLLPHHRKHLTNSLPKIFQCVQITQENENNISKLIQELCPPFLISLYSLISPTIIDSSVQHFPFVKSVLLNILSNDPISLPYQSSSIPSIDWFANVKDERKSKRRKK